MRSPATRWGEGLKKKVDLSGEFILQTSPLPDCCLKPGEIGSPVQEFYRGAHVLITGATGFLGKALTEKLIVACPGIEKIYVIIREKKGQSPEERLRSLLKQDVFKRAIKLKPDFKNLIVPIFGDCSKPFLGLTEELKEELAGKVNIVFHVAATVRFDEKLADAVRVNVLGVSEMLKFCKCCPNLKSVVYVSTAYSDCYPDKPVVKEKVSPPLNDYKQILDMLSNDPDRLNKEEKSLMAPSPNSYSFTKNLAEHLVAEEGSELPISIFRPAIVTSSYKEPMAGWIDSVQSMSFIVIGLILGAIRLVSFSGSVPANIVPVDYCANALIGVAYKNKKKSSADEIAVYNYCSADRNTLTWKEFAYWVLAYSWNWGSTKTLWYPFFFFSGNPLVVSVSTFIMQTVPAYLLDGYSKLTSQKAKMIKKHETIMSVFDLISYFVKNDWSWKDENVLKLWEEMTDLDKKIFPFNIAELDWDEHSQNHCLGLRVYFLKDPLETLPAGRALVAKYKVYNLLLLSALAFLVSWSLYQVFKCVTS